MKRILILLAVLTCCMGESFSQPPLGVQVNWLEPTWTTGYIRSGVPSIQIHYVSKILDRQSRVELFIGATKWKSRKDSVNVYEIYQRNGVDILSDGYMKHQFFPSIFLGATYNKRWTRDDFSGFYSVDFRLNFDSYIEEVDLPDLRTSSDLYLPNLFGGLLPKVGVSYLYDQSIDFQVGIGAAFLMTRTYQFQTYLDPSFKVTFGL